MKRTGAASVAVLAAFQIEAAVTSATDGSKVWWVTATGSTPGQVAQPIENYTQIPSTGATTPEKYGMQYKVELTSVPTIAQDPKPTTKVVTAQIDIWYGQTSQPYVGCGSPAFYAASHQRIGTLAAGASVNEFGGLGIACAGTMSGTAEHTTITPGLIQEGHKVVYTVNQVGAPLIAGNSVTITVEITMRHYTKMPTDADWVQGDYDTEISPAVDGNGDGDFTDLDQLPRPAVPGVDANGDGDFTDAGDTPPVPAFPGYDYNGDGDFTDTGDTAVVLGRQQRTDSITTTITINFAPELGMP